MFGLLTSLTFRGRVLLGLGVASGLASLLVGDQELLRVGALVAVLPLIGGFAVLRGPRGLRHARALDPPRVAVGNDVRVVLRLANPQARVATGALFAADTVARGLGGDPRFSLGSLRPRETRELSYRLHPTLRGRYPVGPLRLRICDPLGCVELRRDLGPEMTLVVTPRVVELPPAPTRGASTDGGPSSTRMLSSAGEDDTVPREYRHGDELRRIHWRSTARQGKPMVRREEQQWQQRCTVLLDMRSMAHRGSGPESTMETAVAVAASIGRRVLADGQLLRLATSDREIGVEGRTEVMMESLAVVGASRASSLSAGADLLTRSRHGDGGLTVAVLGALRPAEVDALTRAQETQGRRLAILNPDAAWSTLEACEAARGALQASGWRVAQLRALEELRDIWPKETAAQVLAGRHTGGPR